MILILGCAFSVEQAIATDRLIFVLAGQSNMSGRGATDQLPAGFPRNGNRIWTFSNADEWVTATEPIDSAKGQIDQVSVDATAGVGPALAFADAVADALPNTEIGLVPCAKGGTAIAEWLPSSKRSTLFGSCLRRILIACKQGTIAALLWHQGESDTAAAEDAQLWRERFRDLVEGFRLQLDAPQLPVVGATLGKLGRTVDVQFSYWSEVQEAQRGFRMPNVVLIDGQPFEVGSDGLHFSTTGQLHLGLALANAYLALPQKPIARCR